VGYIRCDSWEPEGKLPGQGGRCNAALCPMDPLHREHDPGTHPSYHPTEKIMQTLAERAAQSLAHHPAPALSLDQLVYQMKDGGTALGPDILLRALEARPDLFRVLDQWRGPWRSTSRRTASRARAMWGGWPRTRSRVRGSRRPVQSEPGPPGADGGRAVGDGPGTVVGDGARG
jgi:hypothetical protein